jgi:predicted lipid-binding transport protein (Tim44 family)
MRRTAAFLATLFAAAILLAPVLADARAGGGSSMGSRGSRTYSMPAPTTTAPSYAAPMERSMTPNAPVYTPSPAAPAPSYGGAPAMAGARSPFVSGLMGGLIGAGIGGLLFGHGLFGGFTGIFSFLGLLIQIFLVVLVVRWLFRLVTGNRQPAFAGGPGLFARMGGGSPMGGGPRPAPRPAAPTVAIQQADYQAFDQTLRDVQAAWSNADMAALQRLATPEMVSYFADQLATLSSQGRRNTVTSVRLLQGDLSEAWAEGNRQYATVAMRFSMIDVTRDSAGRVVDGSPTESVTATELWTFLRAPGGRWILSAIQQAR